VRPIAILLGLCVSAAAYYQDAARLTLREVIAKALEHNSDVLLAKEEVARQRGALKQARTGYAPAVTATGRFTRNDKLDSVEIAPGQSITIGVLERTDAVLALSIPLDLSGLTKAGVDAAELQWAAAASDYNAQIDAVALAAQNAYYTVLRREKQVRVATASLERARENKRIADVNLEAGTGTKFDVLRTQSQLAEAERQLVVAQTDWMLAKAQLNDVMGRDPKTQVELEFTEDVSGVTAAELEKEVEQALAGRPEIAAATLRYLLAKKGVFLAEASNKASLGLEWDLNWTDQTSTFSPRDTHWSAFATLRIPVFDGGVSSAKKEQAAASVAQADIRLQQTKRLVEIQVQQATYSLEGALKGLEAARRGLQAAYEAHRLARLRFRDGVGTAVEVTDAAANLTEAETAEASARYGVLMTWAQLKRATGVRWWEETDKSK
jgi:outer membrane protein TolC